jgi:peroxiredoxin family protein
MFGAQFVTSEGNEVPYFVALVGLAALELANSSTARAPESEPSTRQFPMMAKHAMQAQGSRRAIR